MVAKQITAEVCVHHLWFSEDDYKEKGNLIKWNPSIKKKSDRDELWKALNDDRIDVIATDHAPHTLEEKQNLYTSAPSGGPMVQHALIALLTQAKKGKITLEKIVEKACHNPAIIFNIENRGYLREGYFADLTCVDLDKHYTVKKDNILFKCGWSPLENRTLRSSIYATILNGNIAFKDGVFAKTPLFGKRLEFNY